MFGSRFHPPCFATPLAQWVLIVCVLCLAPLSSRAQILHVGELTSPEIDALDRDSTVVILPGGILEQHGPYLPSGSDGYMNSFITQRLAEAVVAKPGWSALVFPQIPLGTGGANEIGEKYVFPGTYAVRSTTLRAIFMDLGVELGEQGFKWVFIIHTHGAPNHNRALDEAGDFFHDTYGGWMINLTGIVIPPNKRDTLRSKCTPEEDGDSPHAGVGETSSLLFLKPGLVEPDFRTSPTIEAPEWEARRRIASEPDWPGYFGAPRYSTAACGAERMQKRTESLVSLALDIVDGSDPTQFQRYGDLGTENPGNIPINESALEREKQIERLQQEWLEQNSSK